MNTPRLTIRRLSRLTLLLSGLSLLAYLLYFHKLGTLLPGYSAAEVQSFHSASDWHFLVQNPVNIFYTAPLWFLTAVQHNGLLATRVVSAVIGIVAVLLFFAVAKLRFNYWQALLGSLLFATSSGFLHSARLGTPLILQMGVLALLTAILWFKDRVERRLVAGYLFTAVVALLWYIPGMIWFELLAAIILWKGLMTTISVAPAKHIAGWVATGAFLLAPLVISIILRPHVALESLGAPSTWPTFGQFAHNLMQTMLSIVVRSDGDASLWVGHAPLLNVIEVVLVCIGLYERILLKRTFRSIYAIGCTLIGVLLIALGGPVGFAVLVPFLYIFVTEGLSQLLRQWFAVFPRNPFAKGFGIVLVLAMLAFSITYHVRAYFIAWPHNEQTQQVFRITRP